jgi:hypothetical protein
MNEITPNNAVPPGFRCAPPGEQAPLGGPSGRDLAEMKLAAMNEIAAMNEMSKS